MCNKPIQLNIKDRNGKMIEAKCGHCIGCLIEKQSQLQFLAEKELLKCYQENRGATFITLTYNVF